MGKKLMERLLKLEAAAAPQEILFITSPMDHPFPIEIDLENLPRRFAWGPVLDEWSERHIAEAIASIDWTRYKDYFVINLSDALTSQARAAHFWRTVGEKFSIEDYQRELAEATAWTARNGYTTPENYLEHPHATQTMEQCTQGVDHE